MKEKFTKNYFYNKKSILKLIYLYNYLNGSSLLDDLVVLIKHSSFLPDQAASDALCGLYAGLFPSVVKLDLPFAFVWMFEDRLIFYFKPDFEPASFYKFFSALYSDYKITWGSVEVFDKNIKILEIIAKASLLRSFRNERDVSGKKYKPTLTTIDCRSNDFLFFVTKYNTKNLKLVVHCISD